MNRPSPAPSGVSPANARSEGSSGGVLQTALRAPGSDARSSRARALRHPAERSARLRSDHCCPISPGTLQLFVHRKAFGALEPLVPDSSIEDPFDFENSGSSGRLIPGQEVARVPKPARLEKQRPYAPSLFGSRLIADVDLTSTRPCSREQAKDPGVRGVHRFRA